MPTSIRSVRLKTPDTIELDLKFEVNPTWFTDNQLSEITPLPLAWTKTTLTAKAGSAGCAGAGFGADDPACRSVYDFLSEKSGFDATHPKTFPNARPTYATDPLWQVVDGPWRLQSFGATQPEVLAPNRAYSGPNKPRVSEFIEDPFYTYSAELHALVDGAIDVGYLPEPDLTAHATTAQSGPNLSEVSRRFRVTPVYPWGVDYWPYNFDSVGDARHAGAIFRQLYLRQAMQMLVNQPALIKQVGDGDGVPTVGPVPLAPRTRFVSEIEKKNLYPYDPGRAAALLRSHGWSVSPGGIAVCDRAGRGPYQCGIGVPAGARLTFDLHVISSTPRLEQLVRAETKSWRRVGIRVTASSATFDQVVPFSLCPSDCAWELTTGFGWQYVPDIYPSGEDLFESAFGANNGHFETRHNRALIAKTDRSNVGLGAWENYIARKLPFLWEPQFPSELSAIGRSLNASAPGSLGTITPATWSWRD